MKPAILSPAVLSGDEFLKNPSWCWMMSASSASALSCGVSGFVPMPVPSCVLMVGYAARLRKSARHNDSSTGRGRPFFLSLEAQAGGGRKLRQPATASLLVETPLRRGRAPFQPASPRARNPARIGHPQGPSLRGGADAVPLTVSAKEKR